MLVVNLAAVTFAAHRSFRGLQTLKENEGPEQEARIKLYREVRLPKWMAFYESVLKYNRVKRGCTTGWVVGDEVSFADLALFLMCEGIRTKLPEDYDKHAPEGSLLRAHHEQVKARPRVAAFFASDRLPKYVLDCPGT